MENPTQETAPRSAPVQTLKPGDWMREEIEVRLARGWLAAGAVVLFVLLLVALD